MSDDEKLDRDLAVLSAVYTELGHEAANEAIKRPRTPERQAEVDAMLARGKVAVRIARLQVLSDALGQLAKEPTRTIPDEIATIERDEVISRLRERTLGSESEPLGDVEDWPTSGLQRLLAVIDE